MSLLPLTTPGTSAVIDSLLEQSTNLSSTTAISTLNCHNQDKSGSSNGGDRSSTSLILNLNRDLHRIDQLVDDTVTIFGSYSQKQPKYDGDEKVRNDGISGNQQQRFTSLLQLRDTIRSPFFNFVKEVYFHLLVSSTSNSKVNSINASSLVSTSSSSPLEVGSVAKATAAAFAVAEGHVHPRVICLPKTEQGLGFNVIGGREQGSPIFVSRIILGSVAEQNGGLRRGDQLVAINGFNVEYESHEMAVRLLKAPSMGHPDATVMLVVRYTPRLLDELERRFSLENTRRERDNSPEEFFINHKHHSTLAVAKQDRDQ